MQKPKLYEASVLFMSLFAVQAKAEVEIECSHKVQQIGANYYSQAVFDVGKTIIVEAFGELAEGSHWLPAEAEMQDLNGNWHSRMGNINVNVAGGVYRSMQNWIPQNIGSNPDEFEQVFGNFPVMRCSLTN